jgi:hypothetical protein
VDVQRRHEGLAPQALISGEFVASESNETSSELMIGPAEWVRPRTTRG